MQSLTSLRTRCEVWGVPIPKENNNIIIYYPCASQPQCNDKMETAVSYDRWSYLLLLAGHPSWPHSVLCWPRLTAGQLATNHLTRNVQTSETARPLITIRDTDHTSTHLVRCYRAGVGSRDNDGALAVFICAIIQIKLDPFSGRCIFTIFTLISVRIVSSSQQGQLW